MIILPHGGYTLIPATIATMAWMTSLSLDGCDYARLTGRSVEKITHSNIYPYIEIGYHSYRVPSFYTAFESWEVRFTDPCIPFDIDFSTSSWSLSNSQELLTDGANKQEINDNEIIDPTLGIFWSIGRMGHNIATIVGGGSALFLWVPCICLSYTERTWRIGGLLLIIAAFFQLFSMVWFFNTLCMTRGSSCHFYYGSYASFASFGLYVIGFISVFWKYPSPIIVKLVQKRIEEEFQRYQTNRPGLSRLESSNVTHVTELDDDASQISHHADQQFATFDNSYRQRRNGPGLKNEHEII